LDYACFGDAVSFDTTFQTNKFEMPFAPLLGANHQKQTIIFGCALLFNEIIESFVWLFETFLTTMSVSILAQFSLIKMRPCQEQLLMYSKIQAIDFVFGTFILMLLNILGM
jgi:hypothetical protein